MKTADLLVSNLSITEDDYTFKGPFTLSFGNKSMDLDITDIDVPEKLNEIKTYFGLDEDNTEINKALFDAVLKEAGISSVIKEGENYNEGPVKGAESLDRA